MTLPDFAIETTDLTKSYGRNAARPALDHVSIGVPRGSCFGLLGPNGAGKSTFINILAGLVNKSSGAARIWGYDIEKEMRRARSAIGVVPQELNLDTFFTPREALEFQAGLYGVPKSERHTEALLAAVGLTDKAEAYSRTLSGGMRRRLLIAKALVHRPPVVVLDEPTAGVDIELRQQLWDYVRELNAAGTTIVLTTHYLEEAEELCDRIAIINHGRVIAHDTTQALLARLDNKELILVLARPVEALPPALAAQGFERAGPQELRLRYHPSRTAIGEVLAAVSQSGLEIADLRAEEPDLEDVFLALTRKDRQNADAA